MGAICLIHITGFRAAWNAVKPFGLDLRTGVRTNGRLDADKLRDFFAALAPAA